MAVKKGLKKPGLHFIIHDMGVVDVLEKTTSKKRELINNIKAMLIGKVKNVIIEMNKTGDLNNRVILNHS